ncbi:hypothetical protein [Streptomyces sp. TLI_105]|uniref:hypothetical protein n=1 Tax=Streptomyces sp. TLI_105 TaxID=1881019 RepID=UPI00089B0C94|nr:hypothetical protein [Streptomyces sp. TLI_105]SEC43239.1 hypothetical protein SAMN05428939_2360 [Streptomyces sp. TLI_105]
MDTQTTEKTAAAEADAAEETTTDAVDDTGDDALVPLDEQDDSTDDEPDDQGAAAPEATGVGSGAAAVVSAGLAAVALTGTWTGRVVAERETLIGQIKTSAGGTPAQQIHEIYGDAWHGTALVNGVFALLALIVAALVLTLPRRPAWVRAVAGAGAFLGGLGLLLSVGTYFDLFLSLPTTGS